MILVTGSNGFIGNAIVKRLNKLGIADIISVDYKAPKNVTVAEHLMPWEILERASDLFPRIELVIHQGANTDTTDHSRGVIEENFTFSKKILDFCLDHGTRMIYASSAAVYGNGNQGFNVMRECENPLNIYGYSKLIFDDYVRLMLRLSKPDSQISGLRYFNVYGPGEQSKGTMASVVFHFYNQAKETGKVHPFEGSEDFIRDFIFIEDVVDSVEFLINNEDISGIFNCGTGSERSFMDIASIVSDIMDSEIEPIPFPDSLIPYYQRRTKADMSIPRSIGFSDSYTCLEEGIKRYIEFLNTQ